MTNKLFHFGSKPNFPYKPTFESKPHAKSYNSCIPIDLLMRSMNFNVTSSIYVIWTERRMQAVGALGELSDKSDFSLLAWDSFSQEIRDLLLFYCQKSLNLFQMQ